jgi:chromosome segregation ATPase
MNIDSNPNYQLKIQEIKDEILAQELKSQDNTEEIERLQIIYDLCQEEIIHLAQELVSLKDQNLKLNQEIEVLNKNLSFTEHDSEVQDNIKELEEENKELIRNNELSFSFDKIIMGESNKKSLNETFVVLQKKLGNLETINANLQKKIKKSETDTKNLKKKCENAAGRYKSNDELKDKIKNLEITVEKYSNIEIALQKEIQEAEKQIQLEKSRPECHIDAKTANRLVKEALEGLENEKNKFYDLEKELQDKKQQLEEIRTVGTQSNKITIKLKNDLNLLQGILKEKQQYLQKLEKETQEYENISKAIKEEIDQEINS